MSSEEIERNDVSSKISEKLLPRLQSSSFAPVLCYGAKLTKKEEPSNGGWYSAVLAYLI